MIAGLLPAILLWGLASWGLITAQQARLVALAPALAPVSLSLNSSAPYPGERDRRGSGRAGHRQRRSGAARLGGCGIRSGRAAVGAAQRAAAIRPRLIKGRPQSRDPQPDNKG